jgi:eukaryotic-like serine/threonine-protein kinase
VQPAGEEVRIDVVDHRPDYAVVAAGAPEGPPLRSAPGRPPAPVRMVLEQTPAGWRIDTAERRG